VNLPISFARRADSEPFEDARVEIYARCRARGVTMQQAYKEADIAKATAQKIEASDIFQARLRELKDATQQFTGLTLAAIMQRLLRQADDAEQYAKVAAKNGQPTAAATLLKVSGSHLKELKELVKQDAGRMSGALGNVGMRQSDKKTRESFREALSAPELVETTGEESHDDGH
jgi:hypothetical protein